MLGECSLLAPSCLRTQTHHNAALLSWRCCDHLRFNDFLETIFKESLHFGQNKKMTGENIQKLC